METSPLNILVVDDDADIRTIASLALELDPSIRTTTVGSGAAALFALRQHARAPDVILLDVMMPDMDGRELMGAIRQLPRCLEVPIVFMTAQAYIRETEVLRLLHPAGILLKPFDPLTLADQVRGCLAC